ncbi:MAG: hypothetical protein ABJL72_05385 [Roseobacter sp.]
MPKLKHLSLTMLLVVASTSGQTADFSDPTWPCVQRKVETLSLGLMWPFPVDTEILNDNDALRDDVTELAGYLSLRKVGLEDLQPRIQTFADTYNGDPKALGLVFKAVFETLSKRRVRIISGIGDFSLSQIALAERIDLNRAEIDAILAKDAPDFDRVDTLEEQLDWDQVIYTDRQRNISYLCETPTLLERRLFSVGQALLNVIADPG